MAVARPGAERSEERAEGVRAGALGFDAHSSRAHGCSREAGARIGMVGRALAHEGHVGISLDTWVVWFSLTWRPFLG